MRWRRSRVYPSTLSGAGLPVPTPDGRGPGRERVVVPPTSALNPAHTVPFLWGTSRQVVGLSGGGLSCVDLTNPSLTRHSSGTWPRQGHPPSSPRHSTVLSRPFVVEALLRPSFPFGRRSRKVWERRRMSIISRGRRSTPVARASLRLPVRAAAKSWCTTARPCPWQARRDAHSESGGYRSGPDCSGE
jgi:hypothetical protein